MPYHRHTYRGHRATGQTNARPRGPSQASDRHPITTFDQFGRMFSAEVEKRSGMSVGTIQAQFDAPFKIDPQFIRINPDDTTQCYCDFKSLIAARRTEMRHYHQRVAKMCADKKWETPRLGDYSQEIIDHLGEFPPRAYQGFVAADQGNPWALALRRNRHGEWGPPHDAEFTVAAKEDPRLTKFVERRWADVDADVDTFEFGELSYAQATGEPVTAVAPAPRVTGRRAARQPTETADSLEEVFGVTEQAGQELDDDIEVNPDGDETEVEFDDDSEPDGEAAEDDDDMLADQLADLEDEHDPGAEGGRTVAPQNADRAVRQRPLRGAKTAKARKRGQRASQSGSQATDRQPTDVAKPVSRAWNPNAGKSLADGAKPFVPGGE